MALVDKSSPKVVIPQSLEFFKTFATNMAIDASEMVSFNPTSIFNAESGAITFDIVENSEDYYLLDQTYLTFGLQIVRENGDDITAEDLVGFENNPGDSVFSGFDVTIGDQVVESIKHYPHKAYLETILAKEPAAINSHGGLSMFVKDTAGQMNAVYQTVDLIDTRARTRAATHYQENAPAEGASDATKSIHAANSFARGLERAMNQLNHGLQKRAEYTSLSKIVRVVTKPKCDTFNTGKHIPNGTNIRLKIYRSPPEFVLHADQSGANPQKYQVKITDIKLWIMKVKVQASIFNGHGRNLAAKPARYNLRRTTIKPVTIPQNFTSYTVDNVTVGLIPRRVLVVFIRNDAYDGSYTQNPFNYLHLNLNKIALYVNGKCYPGTPYTPTFTGNNPNYAREYNGLCTVVGINNGPHGIDLSLKDFANGYTIFAFDLSPDKKAVKSSALYLKKTGNTRLEFTLGTATDTVYTCMIHAEYDNIMKIDGNRDVFINYTL